MSFAARTCLPDFFSTTLFIVIIIIVVVVIARFFHVVKRDYLDIVQTFFFEKLDERVRLTCHLDDDSPRYSCAALLVYQCLN